MCIESKNPYMKCYYRLKSPSSRMRRARRTSFTMMVTRLA